MSSVLVVARHPSLWGEAVRAAVALSPRRWWASPPFIPRPDPSYLQWRVATAYGTADAAIEAHDLVAYLRWRRRQRKSGIRMGGERGRLAS